MALVEKGTSTSRATSSAIQNGLTSLGKETTTATGMLEGSSTFRTTNYSRYKFLNEFDGKMQWTEEKYGWLHSETSVRQPEERA